MANVTVDNDWGTGSSAEYLKNDAGGANPSALSVSDDRVGIGTNSPGVQLHIEDASGDVGIRIDNTTVTTGDNWLINSPDGLSLYMPKSGPLPGSTPRRNI